MNEVKRKEVYLKASVLWGKKKLMLLSATISYCQFKIHMHSVTMFFSPSDPTLNFHTPISYNFVLLLDPYFM